MAVAAGQTLDQIGQRLGQAAPIGGIIRRQDLGHTGKLRGFGGGGGNAVTGDQQMHLAQRLGGGQRLGGAVRAQRAAGHFGNQKYGHQITPASSLSFAISSATLATFTPALRPCGSTVLMTARRGVTSTP